jgi:ribonuclease G
MADTRAVENLENEVKRMLKTWREVENRLRSLKGPGLVYHDMSLASSVIRDMFTPDVGSVMVDSRKLYKDIVAYVEDVAPTLRDRIKLYQDRVPIFDKYNIEAEIEKSLSRKIWLTGGGYIFFDQTEALVAIDVNSGGFTGRRDHEENSLQVNLRAAREIARQMRLRDIGGIIVIDFIDMLEESNRFKLFDEMRRNLRMDRAKWDLAPLSPFGLMEMTRQRIRPSLASTLRETCPQCRGTGLVPSLETVATSLERWVKRFASQTRERRLALNVNPEMKKFLTGGLRSRIARIMWSNRLFITINEDSELRIDEFRGISLKQKKDVTDDFLTGNGLKKKGNE